MGLSRQQVEQDLAAAERALKELGARKRQFWNMLRVPPAQWHHEQYTDEEAFWIIAVIGNRCLYYNEVEEGWGWGRFENWGTISEYHWEDYEIQHVVAQTLTAIDNPETG